MTMSQPNVSEPLSSSREGSSSALSTFRIKPQSLNLGSPVSNSLPRPLQLASGTVVTTSPSTSLPASPSPSLSTPTVVNSPTAESGSTRATISDVQKPGNIPSPSPLSPLSPTIANMRRQSSSRRQSSISYVSSNSSSQSSFAKRESVDSHSLGLTRSPLSAHTTTSFSMKSPGLGRSNSVGGTGRGSKPHKMIGIERSSTGSLLSQDSDTAKHLRERAPVTLAEKHAELLHFIAQKESKCLELRSQLAVHEAELLQLKRKWERIVNRGFGKSLSTSASSPTSTSSSTSPSSATHPPPISNNQPYFPGLSPTVTATVPGAVVFEGIKGGVQGVSRLIAAGLESIAGPVAPSASESGGTATPQGPIPLRLNGSTKRHIQKESQSSSSTTTSNFSNASGSSLLSVSTSTSATSASGSSTSGPTSLSTATKSADAEQDADAESEFGEFEVGQTSFVSDESDDHVLMVHDTGATPTMSPNPHFQRRNRKRGSPSPSPSRTTSAGATKSLSLDIQDEVKEDFDWDDGWGEPVSDMQTTESQTTTSMASVGSSHSASSNGLKTPSIIGPLSVHGAGVASLSGLSSISATPTAQHVSSWVGTVGKKWGEIKGSNTFTKNQKRASVLISDMQQSIVSALVSPPPASGSLSSSPSSLNFTLSSSTSRSNITEVSTAPSSRPASRPRSQTQPRPTSTSLLDDSDDESYGEGPGGDGEGDDTVRMKLGMSAPVLIPQSIPTASLGKGKTSSTLKPNSTVSKSTSNADEDEWNW